MAVSLQRGSVAASTTQIWNLRIEALADAGDYRPALIRRDFAHDRQAQPATSLIEQSMMAQTPMHIAGDWLPPGRRSQGASQRFLGNLNQLGLTGFTPRPPIAADGMRLRTMDQSAVLPQATTDRRLCDATSMHSQFNAGIDVAALSAVLVAVWALQRHRNALAAGTAVPAPP